MSIRTKLILVSVGFFFPIALLLYFFITARNEKIIFAQKEMEGNVYLRQVRPLMQFVFRHHLLAYRLSKSKNDVRLAEEIDATRDSIDHAIKMTGLAETQFGTKEASAEKYRALAASWEVLKSKANAAYHLSEAESSQAHTDVIARIREVISFIGDQSNLILDTDIDSYYLMDLTLLRMPERDDAIYQITMLGERIITSGKRTEEDKRQVSVLLTTLRANNSKCIENYRAAFANNPAGNLKPALENFSNHNLSLLQEFATFTEANLVKPDTVVLTLPQFLAAYHSAMQASKNLWTMNIKYLDELLRNRIENTRKELYTNIGAVSVVLLLTAALAGFILREIVRSIGNLSFAAARVSNGDLNVKVALQSSQWSSDELGDLGRIFNAMVESLQTLFIQVEQEQKESARLASEALLEIAERKKTAEALKQEREKVEQYLRVAEVIFVAFDTEARITLLNRKGYQILEYEEGELTGKDWFRVCLPAEEYDGVLQVYREMITGQADPFEYYENQIITKNGKKRYIAWHNSLLRDALGNISGTFSSGEDITERRQAEEALRTSEERFRTLSELAFEGIIIHEQGVIHIANQAFADLFGIVDVGELIGKNGFELLSLTPQSRDIIREQTRTGSTAINVIEIIRPDGLKFYAETQGRDVFYNGRKMRVATVRNITARKQAEDALQKLIMMSDTALRLTKAGYWHTPLDGSGSFYSSEQTVAIFGDPPNPEFRYRIMEDWFANVRLGDEEYAEATLQNFNDAISGKVEMYDSIYAYKRPLDSNTVWIHALGKVIKDEQGRATDMFGVSQDITEFRNAVENINELNRTLEQRVLLRTHQLQSANKELETFSYSVSHDLRAPLRGIDGWSLALMEDYGEQLDTTARQYLERVRSETQRMGQLIDDILRLSVITRTEMKWTTVNLSALAHTTLERLQETYPAREFTFLIQPELVVSGDTNLLEIMFTNLLGNACKFTSKTPLAKIEFGKTFDDGKEVYFIRDNGVGFDMESAKNLFGAFQRMHKQSEFPGTGIGLATVQRIINRHQGSIWVEAAIDEGATFYFTLDSHHVHKEQLSL